MRLKSGAIVEEDKSSQLTSTDKSEYIEHILQVQIKLCLLYVQGSSLFFLVIQLCGLR